MANKSFTVQYIIKARDKYSVIADRIAKSNKKIRDSIKKASESFKKFSVSMRKGGAALTAFATAPILLMARSLKNAASDAQETRSKFTAVFKDVSKESENSAKNLAKNFGLSRIASKQLLSDTGDLLSGFGFTGKASLDLSAKVNELAVDLASFTNFSGGAKGASAALTKALLGERESLKSLGIAILEKDVKAKVALLRSQGQRFATERQAKAYATLMLATEQSKNAIGDFARTSGDLANQERITAARIEDLKVAIGTHLLPIALKITKAIRSVIKSFMDLSPATQKTILVVAGLIAALGPLLLLIGSISFALPALALLFSPLGLAIGLVAAAAYLVIDNWGLVTTFFGYFADNAVEKFNWLKDSIVSIFNSITDFIKNSFVFRAISGMGEALGQLAGAVGSGSLDNFDTSAIKNQFFGESKKTPANLSGQQNVNVGVQVGLDQGLKQTSPTRTSRKSRRQDRGAGFAEVPA